MKVVIDRLLVICEQNDVIHESDYLVGFEVVELFDESQEVVADHLCWIKTLREAIDRSSADDLAEQLPSPSASASDAFRS